MPSGQATPQALGVTTTFKLKRNAVVHSPLIFTVKMGFSQVPRMLHCSLTSRYCQQYERND